MDIADTDSGARMNGRCYSEKCVRYGGGLKTYKVHSGLRDAVVRTCRIMTMTRNKDQDQGVL